MAQSNYARPTDADWTPTDPGVRRRIHAFNDELMIVEFAFEKGAEGYLHAHPHVQASYVARGSFEVTIAGHTETLGAGQSFVVPSGAIHGVRALEDGLLVDSFTPARQDFLK